MNQYSNFYVSPENPASYMIDWLKKTGGYTSNGLTLKEKEELERLRKDIICYRKKNPIKETNNDNNSENSESSNEDEFYDPSQEPKKKGKISRKEISSESYGKFNKKENFKPRLYSKNRKSNNKNKRKNTSIISF